jgi:hypothetical protein
VKSISNTYLFAVVLLAFFISCGKDSGTPDEGIEPEDNMETVVYKVSNEIFPNPERGFYLASEISSADGKGVAEASLRANRLQGRSLVLLEFHLKNYVDCDIAQDYLETIRLKFQSLRDAGQKCILRFCYSNGFSNADKPWDATLEWALRHLEQVTPLIREYYDIIMVVQAGFIGSWGEWYYTENFKDNASRKALVEALLEAVPAERQIELRTPAYKMGLYGYSLADTLTRAEAHQPTTKARLGGHNDCYVSSANDVGTFRSNKDRYYWEAEGLYTIMGGESCELTEYCHCERQSDRVRGALADLEIGHYTYLNNGYHQQVLKRWRDEGCMDEIRRRLGYRFVLEEGQFTKEPEAGKPFQMVLKLRNDGFAPAMNPRDVELVLADKSGKVLKTWPVDSDPRYWMPAQETTIEKTITLPEGISGDVVLYLNLPDPCETIHNNPLFSIRLANEDIWNEGTGYNQLYTFSL